MPGVSVWSLPLWFFNWNFLCISYLYMHDASCLDFVTVVHLFTFNKKPTVMFCIQSKVLSNFDKISPLVGQCSGLYRMACVTQVANVLYQLTVFGWPLAFCTTLLSRGYRFRSRLC
jgi:hypothetical protein